MRSCISTLLFLSITFFTILGGCSSNPAEPDPTSSSETVTDGSGNVYPTVKLGDLLWTSVNLRATAYSDGTPIPNVTLDTEWNSLETPAYCFYDSSIESSEQQKWGALYNWYVVDPENEKSIAPAGWRVPTIDDWNELETWLILNGYNWDNSTSENKIAKSLSARTDWEDNFGLDSAGTPSHNKNGNNSTGFSALPGGCRNPEQGLSFFGKNNFGFWWTSTEIISANAIERSLSSTGIGLNRFVEGYSKKFGYSVRLVKNVE